MSIIVMSLITQGYASTSTASLPIFKITKADNNRYTHISRVTPSYAIDYASPRFAHISMVTPHTIISRKRIDITEPETLAIEGETVQIEGEGLQV